MGAALVTGVVVGPDGAAKVAKKGVEVAGQAVEVAGQAGTIALDALKKTPDVAARFANGAVIVADSAASVVKSTEDIGKAGVDAAEKIGQAGVRVGKAVAPYVKKGVEIGAEVGEVGLEVGAVAVAAAGGGIAYDIAKNMHDGYSGGSSYSGGCGYFGGNKDDDPILSIKDFSQSRAFETKDKVIKQLAKALSSVGINVNENDDADTIVKALVSQIPNPKNGKTFSSDAESQAKVCKAVATALNNVFTPFATKPEEMLVDTSLGTAEMCRLIAEWAHSFSIGVNTEFLAVHASVKNALRAVVMYDGVMSQIWSKIQDKMQLDDNMDRELSPLIEVYNRAQSERRRQELLLNNILHTNLDPADRELANAMADDSKQNILIKKLGLRPGTTEFADTLAMAISGLGTAASIAQRVNKALKTVGMSISEYLSGKDYKEFQNMLDSKFDALMMNKKNLNRKEVHKFLKAAATIRDSFDHKNESRFQNALNGRQDNIMGGADDDEDDPDGAPKTSIGKMVKEFNDEKKSIITEFTLRMSKNYEELLIPIKAMSRKLGTEIPVTDKTDVLKDSLVRLSEMYDSHQKIELALIGVYKTASDRERKARYVNNLRALAVACSNLIENALYRSVTSYFVQLKEAISKIQKTIDYFSDIIASKYGGEVAGGSEDNSLAGGGEDDSLAGEIAKSSLILREVVNEFAYFYYIANVKSNFEQTSAELDKYSVKYNEILGDAVAARIFTIDTELKAHLAKLVPTIDPTKRSTLPTTWPADENDTDGMKILSAVTKWVKDEHMVKKEFYRVLQAIDLYMKAFTSAIVKDPNAVRDIKKILDSTQVIARWFNEETGNNIWKSFEVMMDKPDMSRIEEYAGHYYNYLHSYGDDTKNYNGFRVLTGDSTKDPIQKAKKYIDKSIDFYQGLKNLVNSFIRIGDVFGGNELHKQSFMAPSQIFKGLTNFLRQSALSYNETSLYSVQFSNITTNNFKVENRYFVYIIKSMAAKILTTLGVYDMFERSTPINEINHTRIITGGALSEIPEVLEGASELYFRLPRLIEFYRSFLHWDGEESSDAFILLKEGSSLYKIAMLPELEGIFANIIRLIFQKAVSADIGEYSDSELRTIVTEINNIYSHFHEKKPGQATKSALSEFVIEINRRYGVIKKKDMQDYWKMIKPENAQKLEVENDTNYAILPNENQNDVKRRAPSDRYLVTQPAMDMSTGLPLNPRTQKPFDPYAGRIDIARDTAYDLINKFRKKLDREYSSNINKSRSKPKYSLLFQQAEIEIKRAQSKNDRLKIAFRLIQGADKVTTDINKAVMFHETVVVGLSTLSAIHSIITKFSDAIASMNPISIEAAIIDSYYLENVGLTANGKSLTTTTATVGLSLVEKINTVLPKYSLDATDSKYIHSSSNFTSASRTILDRYLVPVTDTEFDKLNKLFNPVASAYTPRLPATPGNTSQHLPSKFFYKKNIEDLTDNFNNLKHRSNETITLEHLFNNYSANKNAIDGWLLSMKILCRARTNYGEIMKDFIETIYGLSTNTEGLVEVRFTQKFNKGFLQIGFSKLKELVENILSDVKFYFDQFRPYLEKSVIDKYEKSDKLGSVYWIEKHLIDKIIRPSVDDRIKSKSLDGISRRANLVLQGLLRKTGFYMNVVSGLTTTLTLTDIMKTAISTTDDNSNQVKYGNSISSLLYYGSDNGHLAALQATSNQYENYLLAPLMLTARIIPSQAGKPVAITEKRPKAANGNNAMDARYPFYKDDDHFMSYRSILFAFNQVLSVYLKTIVDKSGGDRVYFPLINAIANGVLSTSVMDTKKTFHDIAANNAPFGVRGAPEPDSILFHSLALVLQRLIKDANPSTQVSYHLLSTLTDVPLYMKESYRVNLPSFIKFFDFIYQKCEFIKQFIQKTPNLILTLPIVPVSGSVKIITTVNIPITYPSLQDSLKDINSLDTSIKVKDYFLEFVDSISSVCYVVSNSITEVLKELGDIPVYGQLYENSIEMYQSKNGKLPLTPISMIFSFLGELGDLNLTSFKDPKVFPNQTLGGPNFKLLYANRHLISKSTPVGYDQIPGVKVIVDAYNGVTSSTDQLENERYLSFLNNVVNGVRFVVDIRSYKAQITPSTMFPISTNVVVAGPINLVKNTISGPSDGLYGIAVYFVNKKPTDVVSTIESSDQIETYNAIGKDILSSSTNISSDNKRKTEQIDNIIDMNIIPINVHALMRDIPLVNLYNYAFTFDQMLDDMHQYKYSDENLLTSANNAFVKLIKDPYSNLETTSGGASVSTPMLTDSFDTVIDKIFQGEADLGLGRPKFLSDQIYNKLLVGSIKPGGHSIPEVTYYSDNGLQVVGDSTVPWPGTFNLSTFKSTIATPRFNTIFIRNLFFITNVSRIIRLKLNRELTQNRNVIVSSHSTVTASMTEYGSDPFSKDEHIGSNRFDELKRYNDHDGVEY
jgi:ribosomal protein S15P/S13E